VLEWRAGAQCRKIIRSSSPIPTYQTRQGAHARGIRHRCSLPKAPKVDSPSMRSHQGTLRRIHVAVAQAHRRAFRRAPELYGADRGFFRRAKRSGVRARRRQDGMYSQRGGSNAANARPTKVGGVQARPALSRRHRGTHLVLMRGRGMKRCRAGRRRAFALFVGAAVLGNKPHDRRRAADQAIVRAGEKRSDKPAPIIVAGGTKSRCASPRRRPQLHLADADPCRNNARRPGKFSPTR